MTLTIGPVRTTAELREFIALPRLIYRGMPGFVPPLDYERRMLLDPEKAPFYTHGEGAYWLARHDGKAIGRISAQTDRLASASGSAQTGCFGCLDAVDDPAVVPALTTAAEAWIVAHGGNVATGPYLLSINGESGLLVDGQSTSPMTMMPWHPPYLEGLLVGAGYARVQTLLAFSLDLAGLDIPAWQRRIGRRRRSVELRVRGLRMRDLAGEADILRGLFNDAWSSNWGFVPIAGTEIRALLTGFRHFINTDCGIVVDWNQTPVGFMFVLPNLFDIMSDLGGAPGLLGWTRLLFRVLRRPYRSARVILMGIAKQYQGTPLGAEIAVEMVLELARRGGRYGMTSIEAGWILEGNIGMISILQTLGFRQCRAYGIFEKLLEPQRSACQGDK